MDKATRGVKPSRGDDAKTLEDLALEDYPEVKIISHKDVKLGYEYPIDCTIV